jgi:hypothetical protein
MCMIATAAQSSIVAGRGGTEGAAAMLLQWIAREGLESDGISNGRDMPPHLEYCGGNPRIYEVRPVFLRSCSSITARI